MAVLDMNSTGTPNASPTATPNKMSFEKFLVVINDSPNFDSYLNMNWTNFSKVHLEYSNVERFDVLFCYLP